MKTSTFTNYHCFQREALFYPIIVFLLGVMIIPTVANSQTYCAATGNCDAFGDVIHNFSFNTIINNSTGCNNTSTGYTYFSNISTIVSKGQTYSMSVQSDNTTAAFAVWIDYNQDGDFGDAGEFVYTSPTPGTSASGLITIPATATSGTTRMRVMSSWGTTATIDSNDYCAVPATLNWGEVEDYNITILPSVPNDAGVASIDSPAIFCPGTYDVKATIQNYGINQIDTITVNWSVDGVTQTPVFYYNSLDTIGGTGSSSALITLGSVSFSAGTAKTVKVWTSDPNNQADTVNINDTLTRAIGASIAGSYSIGGTGADFTTVSGAVNYLTTFGVCGPVIFTIAPGTYTEQVTINEIPGASATNNIVFQSSTGDSTDVVVRYGASGTADNWVLKLDGADFVTFRNVTLKSTGSTYTRILEVSGGANNNLFLNNYFDAPRTTSTSANYYVIYSGSDLDENNSFIGNRITGGNYGFYWYGSSTSGLESGTLIEGNYIDARQYGIYVYYQDAPVLRGNVIRPTIPNATSYGIYAGYSDNGAEISGNEVIYPGTNGYGIYIYYSDAGTASPAMVYNNFISIGNTGTAYGIYNYYSTFVNYYNNSVNIASTSSTGGRALYIIGTASDIRIINNILSNTGGGHTFYAASAQASAVTAMDYNVLYSSGTELGYWGVAVPNNLADWQSISGRDTHSVILNPPFISSTDLRLDQSVPFVRGAELGISTDIDNDPRCTFAPTIGADESYYPDPLPVAGFAVPDTLYLNSPYRFLNAARASDPKQHFWYVDGVLEGTDLHFTHTPGQLGSVTVKLITENCTGFDTVEHVISVENPTRAPEAAFIAENNVVNVFEALELTDLSSFGATSWEWIISPDSIIDPDFGGMAETYFWEQGNENSQNPVISFYFSGLYSVCQVVTNSFGSDTLCITDYIEVREPVLMCGARTSTNDPEGMIYDDGGPDNNHASGVNCSFLIDPCADSIVLEFSQFELHKSTTATLAGLLRVYDGQDNTGTPLWNVAAEPRGMIGTMSDASFVRNMVAHSGSIYIEFQTGTNTSATYQKPGFAARWTSYGNGSAPAPEANFMATDTICVGMPVSFENLSAGNDLAYSWEVDGSVISSSESLTHTFTTAGTKSVKLSVENCGGIDEVTRNIVVVNPARVPDVDFTADIRSPDLGETVNFFDETPNCIDPGSYQWTITPGSFTFVNGTNANNMNPQVQFNATGNYTVKLRVANNLGADSVTKTAYINVVGYCTPTVQNLTSDIGITRVRIGSIDNRSTSGEEGYTSYRHLQPAVLEYSSSYVVTVYRGSNLNPVNRAVWIDYNQDGDFNDPGELVAFGPSSFSLNWSDTITVPISAAAGATVMRVGVNYGNLANLPCGPNRYGEYEDYRVFISPDITAPQITLLGNDTVVIAQCAAYTDAGATAEDNVDGNITTSIQVTGLSFDSCVIGAHTIIYEVSDAAGNTTVARRTVIVEADTIAPVITLAGNNPDTIEVHTSYVEAGYSATDNLEGNITAGVVVTGNVDIAQLGTYRLTYSVADAQGNIATVTRDVVVVDRTAPVVDLLGQDTVFVEACTGYNEAGATVSDNYDTGLQVTISGNVDTTQAGTYTLSYCATDASGNRGCIERVVIVQDTENPSVSLRGSDIVKVEVLTTFNDPGLNISDGCNTNWTVTTGGTWGGMADSLGYFTIIYTVTDAGGNDSSVTRVIHVVDTQSPFIELAGDAVVFLARWENWTDPGVTVSDNFDPNPRVDTTGNFTSTLMEGMFFRTYQAFDQSGNASRKVTRTIYVALDTTTSVGDQPEISVNIYPNPNRGQFVVELETQNTAQVKLAVTDMMGREIITIHEGNTNGGKFNVDISSIKQGIYFIRLQSGDQVVIKKFVVVK